MCKLPCAHSCPQRSSSLPDGCACGLGQQPLLPGCCSARLAPDDVRMRLTVTWALPVAQMVKNPPAMRETGFDPWVGKSPWRREWQPTPGFWPGESHGQRSLAGYSPRGCQKSTRLSDFHPGPPTLLFPVSGGAQPWGCGLLPARGSLCGPKRTLCDMGRWDKAGEAHLLPSGQALPRATQTSTRVQAFWGCREGPPAKAGSPGGPRHWARHAFG